MTELTTLDAWRTYAEARGYTAPESPPTDADRHALQRAIDYITAEYISKFAEYYRTNLPSVVADAIARAASLEKEQPKIFSSTTKISEQTFVSQVDTIKFERLHKDAEGGDISAFITKDTLIDAMLIPYFTAPNSTRRGVGIIPL